MVAAGGQQQSRVVLDGVSPYRVMEPLYECVRIVLSYRGERYTPAYIQGLSGAAFRIAGICPCAPTCSSAMDTQDLIVLLGYESEYLSLCDEGIDAQTEVHNVVARVQEEIRAGRPALVWHAFTWAEWDVVCGFDEPTKQFLGRGSYKGLDDLAVADETRTATCGDICPEIGVILIGDKVGELDARAAEISALEEGVHHARSQANVDKLGGDEWTMLDGLACYDRWIEDMRTLDWKPGMGDRYCMGVYRSTRRAAAAVMREIAPRYPNADPTFQAAASQFDAEAAALNACAELLFPDWQIPETLDSETRHRAASLVFDAQNGYARAIDEIERGLSNIKG